MRERENRATQNNEDIDRKLNRLNYEIYFQIKTRNLVRPRKMRLRKKGKERKKGPKMVENEVWCTRKKKHRKKREKQLVTL